MVRRECFEARSRRACGGGLAVPHDVEDDVFECGIFVVTVSAPAVVANVHFDVAARGSGIAELDHGVAKVRATLDTRETGMKNPHALAVHCGQLIAAQALVLPDGLEKFFRRRVVRVAKFSGEAVACAPFGVKVGYLGKHLELLLRRASRKVKRRNGKILVSRETKSVFRLSYQDEFNNRKQNSRSKQSVACCCCVLVRRV